MFLAQNSHFPSFSFFRIDQKQSHTDKFDVVLSSFDESISRRLKALNPPSISLEWLSMAVDFLSFVHTEARSLISNMKFSDLDGSLALYLDESVKILDICNSVSWEIEQLSQRRLLLNFVLHLLNFSDSGENLSLPAPEKLRKARDSLCGWDNCSSGFRKRNFLGNLEVLIRDLALGLDKAPCERISSVEKLVRRTVHAVRMVTVFVAGVLISSLHGLPEVVAIRVPAEFLWADSFNELESTISGELKRRFRGERKKGLFEEVDFVVSEACDVIDDLKGAEDEKKLERLNVVVKELQKVIEAFSEGLDRLSKGVNAVFHTVLCNRKAMLENVRVGQGKQTDTKVMSKVKSK